VNKCFEIQLIGVTGFKTDSRNCKLGCTNKNTPIIKAKPLLLSIRKRYGQV